MGKPSFGFPARFDSNQPARVQKVARDLEF